MTIEDSVVSKLRARGRVGLRKYGHTMDRTDLSRLQWLRHAQEEAMDLIQYLEVEIQREERSFAFTPEPTSQRD